MRRREGELLTRLVGATRVVFATNAGAARREICEERFDLVVVDEAAQALEASCWIPLLKGDRAILAGDHKQLPPTVKCDGIEAELLGRTLFERLMEDKRPGCNERRSVLLTTQYRMHGDICAWASAASYGGLLEAAPVCVRRDLYQDYLANDEDRLGVMVHVDTCGLGLDDDSSGAEEHGAHSVGNEGEARVVVKHVELLLKRGMAPGHICVVAPYHAQVTLLRTMLPADVDCKTVDGYQGGERDAVVLSLTRSNPHRVVGFLADERRLNVAVTRARRHVCVVGDSDTVRTSPFIAALLDHVATVGDYVSAAEYLPAAAVAVVAAPVPAPIAAAPEPTPAAPPAAAPPEPPKPEAAPVVTPPVEAAPAESPPATAAAPPAGVGRAASRVRRRDGLRPSPGLDRRRAQGCHRRGDGRRCSAPEARRRGKIRGRRDGPRRGAAARQWRQAHSDDYSAARGRHQAAAAARGKNAQKKARRARGRGRGSCRSRRPRPRRRRRSGAGPAARRPGSSPARTLLLQQLARGPRGTGGGAARPGAEAGAASCEEEESAERRRLQPTTWIWTTTRSSTRQSRPTPKRRSASRSIADGLMRMDVQGGIAPLETGGTGWGGAPRLREKAGAARDTKKRTSCAVSMDQNK